jgi:hypothetical protein
MKNAGLNEGQRKTGFSPYLLTSDQIPQPD